MIKKCSQNDSKMFTNMIKKCSQIKINMKKHLTKKDKNSFLQKIKKYFKK